MSSVSKQPWYFGKLDDEEVERRLHGTKTGTHLVKTSPKGFTLCVNECGRVCEYPIARVHGRCSIKDRQFADVNAILDFYKTHMLDTCVLTDLASKEGLPNSPTSPASTGGSFKY